MYMVKKEQGKEEMRVKIPHFYKLYSQLPSFKNLSISV